MKHLASFLLGAATGVLLMRYAENRVARAVRSEFDGDELLQAHIRARLRALVSHPRAIHVEVAGGCVLLTGDVLGDEMRPLLEEIQALPGVQGVQNELHAHASREVH